MAHVLVAALPFAGHVIPFTGVFNRLDERGHRVIFYSGSRYRHVIEAPLALGVPAGYRCAIVHTINAALTRLHNKSRARIGLRPTNRPGLEGTWSSTADMAQDVRERDR